MDPTNGPIPAATVADVLGTTTAAPPPVDTKGTSGPVPDAGLTQRIERAASVAVDQHLAETPRKRGQRGPDRAPRRPRNVVPLAPMGNGAPGPHLAEAPPVPLAIDWEAPSPAFDEAATKACIDIAIGLLNDGAAAVVGAVAKKETGDNGLAKEAGDAVRMSEKIEAAIRAGALGCAKKYAVRMDYASEVMLGGGLVIWAGGIGMAMKNLRAKGRELREAPKAAA